MYTRSSAIGSVNVAFKLIETDIESYQSEHNAHSLSVNTMIKCVLLLNEQVTRDMTPEKVAARIFIANYPSQSVDGQTLARVMSRCMSVFV